jgi:hypothetical protein
MAFEYFKQILMWIWRHKILTIVLIFVLPILIGIILRMSGAFDIYDYYGVDPVTQPKTGGIWDYIWELRGQPPGFETDPDGLWTIKKISGEGLNGPINPIFIPFEFWLVDLMIYLPAFLLNGIIFSLNIDLFSDYFLPIIGRGMLYQKFLYSGAPGIVVAVVIAFIVAAFILLIPLILGFYLSPILEFIALNFINILILLGVFTILALVGMYILEPEATQQFIEGLLP